MRVGGPTTTLPPACISRGRARTTLRLHAAEPDEVAYSAKGRAMPMPADRAAELSARTRSCAKRYPRSAGGAAVTRQDRLRGAYLRPIPCAPLMRRSDRSRHFGENTARQPREPERAAAPTRPCPGSGGGPRGGPGDPGVKLTRSATSSSEAAREGRSASTVGLIGTKSASLRVTASSPREVTEEARHRLRPSADRN